MKLNIFVYILISMTAHLSQGCKKLWSKECEGKKTILVLPKQPLQKYQDKYLENQRNRPPSTAFIMTGHKENSSSKCTRCGVIEENNQIGQIIHGHDAPENHFPWQVLIEGTKLFCGGVLVSSQWVLTVAHCIKKPVNVHIGMHKLNTNSPHTLFRKVVKQIIHKSYKSNYNDIGLLKLKNAVPMNDHIKLACLPKNGSHFLDAECYFTGWGFTDYDSEKVPQVLQELRVKIMTKESCRLRWLLTGRHIGPGQMCTELHAFQPESGACLGDSGGPISCKVNGVYYVAGLASLVQKYCTKFFLPDIFTDVSEYREWIEDTIQNN